jgi:deoxyribonuclease-4
MARTLLLGAHMSIQGGIHRAVERGADLGCTALQVFTRNNVQWHTKPLTDESVQRFREAWDASDIGPVVAHANYLINLAATDERFRRLSFEGLVTELRNAATLAIPWVILHPGNHMGQGEEAGLRQVAELANRALEETADCPAGLLLETTAGQGTCLGHTFEQLAWLLDTIEPDERLGVCFDTCHVFAAGYDLRTESAYRSTLRKLDRTVGLDRVRAFHLNDARRECGSRVDRHAHIGRGAIGLHAFGRILRSRRFAHVPKLLETPKHDEDGTAWDPINLATLRRLAERKSSR